MNNNDRFKKVKSCPKQVVDFESNLESIKNNKRFYLKKIKVTITQTINKSVSIVSNQDQIKVSVSVRNVVELLLCT